MSDIFQEVDEELRRQQIDKTLRTYGPFVAGAAFVVLAGVGGYYLWDTYQDRRAAAAGDLLIQGMEFLAGGNQSAAAMVFAGLAEDAPGDYPMLARFHEASALRQSGDTASALAIYDEIAGDGSNPEDFVELAQFYGGLTALGNDAASFEDVQGRLGPVADGSGPWRFHAREALGYAAYRASRFEDAANHYRQLTDDPLTPAGVAGRATEMLNLTEAATE